MTNKEKRIRMFFVLMGLASIASIFGCSTVKVPMTVTHPAEINMSAYGQIAVSDVRGNMGQAFADSIKNKLVESERFKVVDRQRLNQLMDELKLSQSDLVEEKNRIKLGKLLSASAMIAGHTEGNYKEETTSKSGTCTKDKVKYRCTSYYRKGVYSTSGSIDVIDMQTGQILRSKALKAAYTKTTSAMDDTPPSIDKDDLTSAALLDNVNIFLKAISPWKETVLVPFKKDSKIPELERGINQAKIGEVQETIKIFDDACKSAENNPTIKADSIATAYWNLGLAYEYSWEFDKAIEAFKRAYSINPDTKFINEKANAEMLKAEKNKLEEQAKAK